MPRFVNIERTRKEINDSTYLMHVWGVKHYKDFFDILGRIRVLGLFLVIYFSFFV